MSRTTELSEEADILWRKAVKLGGRCLFCGNTHGLEAHHLHHRGGTRYRWDIRNGICLCKWDHARFHGDAEDRQYAYLRLSKKRQDFIRRTERFARDTITDKAGHAEKAIEKLKGIIEANP